MTIRLLSIVMVLAGLVTGCQTARMPVPETLAASERLPVEGRQGWKVKEHLRFGPYEAAGIRRSWTRGSDLQVLVYEGNRRKQRYAFTLRNGQDGLWQVSCETFLRKRTITTPYVDVELKNRSELDCTLRSEADADEVWDLSLRETRERPLEGQLSRGGTSLSVLGTNRIAGALPAEATTGYEVLDGTRAVTAVEVINAGAVHLDGRETPARRDLLSAVAAALLLLEDLRGHLPDDTAAN